MRQEAIDPSLESWRAAARRLLSEGIPPDEVVWRESSERNALPGLFDAPSPPAVEPVAPASDFRVPRAFLELAESVARHKDAERWGLLYTVLWRIARERRDLGAMERDGAVVRLRRMASQLAEEELQRKTPGASEFVPATADLEELRRAAASCRGCDLYRHATQTVFGKGPSSARAVLVGEAPGDQEDLQGAPFVGPAGEVLDRALVEAGLPREEVYVTNAVKHFKFIHRGKRRIHQTPGTLEIGACRPWLDAELALLKPRVLVCLGATASKALLGPEFRLMKERGRFLDTHWAPKLLATLHPSAVLRAEDVAGQERLYGLLVSDLRLVAGELAGAA